MIGFIPKKIIISGDSAGGSLSSSIMVALSNIRRIEPSVNLPEAVFLFYPISSMYPSMRPSFLTNARSSLITPYGLLKMVPVYLPDVREMIDENQNSNSLKDSYRVAARQSEAAMRIPIISSIIDSLSWVFSLEDWTMKPYVWDDSEFQKILDATTISRCPMVSPIFFDDFQSLRDVSLYTYSCSFDGLLDDGVMISKKWKGKTKFTVMNNLQHGFLYVMFRKDTQKACDLIANDLKAVIECEGKFEHLSNNNV
jgi:acetyl esterase/lipase